MKLFKLDINLDDEEELSEFMRLSFMLKGRALAKKLGFEGNHSVTAACGLKRYALNKYEAMRARSEGQIATALDYERICDYQYSHCIQPFIECW